MHANTLIYSFMMFDTNAMSHKLFQWNASAPGEQAPMNPTIPNNPNNPNNLNNPNGVPIEPTKGCEFNKPQRPLAYVLNVFMSTQNDMDIHSSIIFDCDTFLFILFYFFHYMSLSLAFEWSLKLSFFCWNVSSYHWFIDSWK